MRVYASARRRPRPASLLGGSALLFALATANPAKAHSQGALAGAVALSLVPALGPEARFRTDDWVENRLVFAWPFQIPLTGAPSPSTVHRLVVAPEFVAFSSAADGGNEDTFLRFRLGYRAVAGERFIAGLGLTADAESTLSVSPELGLRTSGFAALYVVARVERSLIEDDPLRANLLFGFQFY